MNQERDERLGRAMLAEAISIGQTGQVPRLQFAGGSKVGHGKREPEPRDLAFLASLPCTVSMFRAKHKMTSTQATRVVNYSRTNKYAVIFGDASPNVYAITLLGANFLKEWKQ